MRSFAMIRRATAMLCVVLGAASGNAQLAPPPAPLSKPGLATPSPAAPVKPALQPITPRALPAAAPQAAAAPPIETAWPWRFELQQGERLSTALAVTQPGAVRVELKASGTPLVLSLRRPDGRLIERSGAGALVLDDTASAADVERGVLWSVGIRAAREAPAPTPAAAAAPPPVVAQGSVEVQRPAVQPERVSSALDQALKEAQQRAAAAPAAPGPAAVNTAQAQALQDGQMARRHADELVRLKATIPPAAFEQMNRRIEQRLQGQSLQQALVAVPVQPVTLAQAPTSHVAPMSVDLAKARPALLGSKGATGSSTAAATASVAPVGAGGAAAAAAPALAPSLVSTSAAQGDPGAPVTLTGRDFGDGPGEVHFIVGNGRDLVAPVTFWSSAQIVTEVPYADGLPAYDGHVYVKRADGAKSALRPFAFLPLYDVAVIGIPANSDYHLAPSVANQFSVGWGSVGHTAAALWGFKGDDKFYLNSQLRNGWVVERASVSAFLERVGYGGVYVVDSRPGTTSPFVQVRWWLDAGVALGGSNSLKYSIGVTIKRPKNLPCAASPCPAL